MMEEMAALNDAVFPSKIDVPPMMDFHPKKSKKAAAKPTLAKFAHSSGSGGTVPIPDEIATLLKPGRIYYGKIDTEVNSDVPGPVLATIESGKLQGSKLLGGFQKAHGYVVLKFKSMTLPNGDVYPLTAYAINSNTLQDGIETDVDHHYLARYGAMLGGAFLYGFGQAEMYAGGAGTVTQYGTPVFVPNTQTTISQSMMGLGMAGQQLSTETAKGFNRPSTVTVKKGTAVGILIIDAGKVNPANGGGQGGASANSNAALIAKQQQQLIQLQQQKIQQLQSGQQQGTLQGYSPVVMGGNSMMPGGGMMPMLP